MVEEEDLYREIIVDHSQSPRNQGTLEKPTHQHHGYNPLCGDEIELYLEVGEDRIQQVLFQGSGCAISQASASMLTQQLKGKTTAEAAVLIGTFKDWMKDRQAQECPESLGDIEALSGVRSYPVRVKCALLAWTTLEHALSGD
ncbi:MAG: SUF system NifU family Fe-S cluster assembly protein [Candidatus Eremiobacteraeota bacterium]|nr:SUF system NifU family Fe-S cluster assembly protein [Candidatus Eremiobacteraeota bacterium]